MNLAFISHAVCLEHRMGAHHPECPERLRAIQDRLVSTGMEMLVTHYDAPQATLEQLAMVHDRAYIDRIVETAPSTDDELAWIDGDTALNHRSLPAALHSAGAAMLGVDLVMGERHHAAFCSVRPPGHHAKRDSGSGFCIFNNVAIAAVHALTKHGLERVAIVDFDVHHGDGTQAIFSDDQRVLFCSSFQHPFYPGTGAESDAPNVLNLPLPKLTDGEAFREAVSREWLPRLDAFKPQLILVSAGFDSHRDDDMAHLNLLEADFGWMTRELHHIARSHSDERIVSCLEGGYNLDALARCVATHIDELIGHP